MSEIIGSADFQRKVLDAKTPVLVDFFATWCGPCKMLSPVIEDVAKDMEGKASVYKVDVDQSPDLAAQYGIMSVPTIMVFEGGRVKNKALGAQPKAAIQALFA